MRHWYIDNHNLPDCTTHGIKVEMRISVVQVCGMIHSEGYAKIMPLFWEKETM